MDPGASTSPAFAIVVSGDRSSWLTSPANRASNPMPVPGTGRATASTGRSRTMRRWHSLGREPDKVRGQGAGVDLATAGQPARRLLDQHRRPVVGGEPGQQVT